MASKVIIQNNAYHDSVTLMSLSGKVLQLDGVEEAVVSMATPMNKDLLKNIGLLTEEANNSSENDLLIAVKADTEERIEEVITFIEEQLTSKKNAKKKGGTKSVKTLTSALNEMPEANIAVISVPGEFAAREAKQALKLGLHVMLFSDNVSAEDEKALKEMAREKGLFVMGPDCGTAIVNQGGLCFANKINKGNIGLVAASGTGLQEVTVQIDRLGYGISQAIGTGGRDLYESIGGIMMLEGLKALEADEQTEVIVLISKPPSPTVQERILNQVKQNKKPVVVCFIDGSAEEAEAAGATFSPTLMDAAKKAVKLVNPSAELPEADLKAQAAWIKEAKKQMADSQKYVRGLFCGGTLTSEALSLLREYAPGVKSNVAKKKEEKVGQIERSVGHTLLDLGDDAFTVGKPHPMIEPSLRNNRILQEAKDPETAVLLLDFELGYGSHDDPVGITVETIEKAKDSAKKDGRYLPIVAYICGTTQDKQGYAQQEKRLKAAGVYVASSNEEATKLAARLISIRGEKRE
jgi:FdrA protein